MPKVCPAIYLGPSEKINGYILYNPVKKTIFESSSVIFDEYVFGVSNLLKHIDRGNIPHYFNTYLNEKFIDFSKLSDCDNVLSMNTNPVDCVHEQTENDSADENEPELSIELDNYEMFDYPPDDHDPDPYAPADHSASSYSSSTYNSETDPEVDFNLVTQFQSNDEINIFEPNESDDAAEEVRHSAHFQNPNYQHSTIGKVFSALKIPWNMFGEPGHGYKDLDFLDYAFHADQVVNNKVTP